MSDGIEDGSHDDTVTEIRDFVKAGVLGTIYLKIESVVAMADRGYQAQLRTYLTGRAATSILNHYVLKRVDIPRFEQANPQWKDSIARASTRPDLQQIVDAMIDRALAFKPEPAESQPDPHHSCNPWLYSLEPRRPREGRYTENHTCPLCRVEYVVEFQCEAMLGGGLECSAVGAATVNGRWT